MTNLGVGSSVKATLSIDTDPIEVVHERLIRKGNQNANRAEVIDQVRGLIDAIPVIELGKSVLSTSDKFKLSLILNSDCDSV